MCRGGKKIHTSFNALLQIPYFTLCAAADVVSADLAELLLVLTRGVSTTAAAVCDKVRGGTSKSFNIIIIIYLSWFYAKYKDAVQLGHLVGRFQPCNIWSPAHPSELNWRSFYKYFL